ncbi:MAG: hypothetical protein ACHQQ3_13375 [Gemmatimonadales bacterium]
MAKTEVANGAARTGRMPPVTEYIKQSRRRRLPLAVTAPRMHV